MEPENCWFVDVFPFPRGGHFQVPCSIVWGVFPGLKLQSESFGTWHH